MTPTLTGVPRRHAILVDAGYLLAASAHMIQGTSLRRSIDVDWTKLILHLKEGVAERAQSSELLRLFWYDATDVERTGKRNREHELLPFIDDVKLRLGRMNSEGQQKGVDLRIGLDMVNLALQKAVTDVYLISGDDDISEAVEMAQEYGLRVHLFNVPDETSRLTVRATAYNLVKIVDTCTAIKAELLRNAIKPSKVSQVAPVTPVCPTPAPVPAPPRPGPVPSPAMFTGPAPFQLSNPSRTVYSTGSRGTGFYYGEMAVDHELAEHIPQVARTVAKGWLDSITPTELQEALREKPSIPQDVDRSLLQDLTTKSGDANHMLSYDLKVQLRSQFWEAVERAGSRSRN
ncbi:NYN domain-containing protein [Kocuria oceani]|uniref:NYN domain-containing protein n=1 Tax=Kocuria oceani TaxID=988827 RepID=UPI004036825E